MKKTPEEIKKGLECCYSPVEPMLRCEACPYNGSIVCKMRLNTDALAYIQRLEAQNAELVRKTDKLQSSMGQVQKALRDNGFQTLEALLQAYSQVKRERDALENDLYSVVNDYVTPCFCCKIFDTSTTVCDYEGVDCFIWRGVQEQPKQEGENDV